MSGPLARPLRRLRAAPRAVAGRWVGSLTRVRTSDPAAALTFDDGPDPRWTPAVLAALEAHGARGTFFMLGERAAAAPELVARVAGAGHAVGNHTWDHPSLPALPRRLRRAQIRRCAAALGSHGGPWFRPPYTQQSLGSWLDARREGYRVVAWSTHAADWEPATAAELAERLRRRVRPGAVVLLHDALRTDDPAAADRDALVEALRLALPELTRRMRLVTVPELTRAGRPVYEPWFVRDAAAWARLERRGAGRPGAPAGRPA